MDKEKVSPDSVTYTSLAVACAEMQDLDSAKHLHAHITNSKTYIDTKLYNILVSMFVSCGKPEVGIAIFQDMKQRNVPTSSVTYLAALRACAGHIVAITIFKAH